MDVWILTCTYILMTCMSEVFEKQNNDEKKKKRKDWRFVTNLFAVLTKLLKGRGLVLHAKMLLGGRDRCNWWGFVFIEGFIGLLLNSVNMLCFVFLFFFFLLFSLLVGTRWSCNHFMIYSFFSSFHRELFWKPSAYQIYAKRSCNCELI